MNVAQIDLGGDHGGVIEVAGPAEVEARVRAGLDAGEASPGFWAHLWPATVAMARFIARTPLLSEGMRVVELGCGLGAVGVACARRGCDVVLTDGDERGVTWARENAARNGVDAACAVYEWGSGAEGLARVLGEARGDGWGPDVIVGSDILYAPEWHGPLAELIRATGVLALIADPCRDVASGALGVFEGAGLRAWDALIDGGGEGACRVFVVHPG